MKRDEDERNVKSQNELDAQNIDGEAQSEDEVVAPDADIGSDPSAESGVAPAAPTPREADSVSGDSRSAEMPEAPAKIAASDTGAAMQPGGNVTRIELPADLEISPTEPVEVPGDRQVRVPVDRGGAAQGESNPIDQIFPPEWRLPVDTSASLRVGESAATDRALEDRGHAAPRVQVLVTLVEARAMYAEAITEALDKKAPKYRQIAESAVERGFWRYENQRRAADWRLRGP